MLELLAAPRTTFLTAASMCVQKVLTAILPRFDCNFRPRRRRKYFLFLLSLFLVFTLRPIFHLQSDPDKLKAVSAGIASVSGLGSITFDRVQPNVSTVTFQPDHCSENGSNVFTLFMVISSPENRRARDETRAGLKIHINNYKGSQAHQLGVRSRRNLLLFFIGVSSDPSIKESVKQEARIKQDVVLDSMSEAYLRLTQKTLRMLKWVRSHCPEAEFVVKMDDDIHVNLNKFYTFLNAISGVEKRLDFVGGRVFRKARAIRDPDSKWFVPMQFWSQKKFPDYVGGYFYVLGRRALKRIYETSLNLPLFHLEDVFVTGIVASKQLRLNLTALPNILYKWSPTLHLLASSCDIETTYLLVHFHMPVFNYLKCWSRFNSPGFVCDHWPLILDWKCWWS